jgi:hypothetical protein
MNPGGQANPLGFTLAGLADQRDNENTDYGLNVFKNNRDFGRTKSDLVDRFSSQGTARSGILGQQSDRLNQDFQFNGGQAELLHRRALDQLEQQRRFATLGVY